MFISYNSLIALRNIRLFNCIDIGFTSTSTDCFVLIYARFLSLLKDMEIFSNEFKLI